MYATKIKMKLGCYYSYNLTEIDMIYIEDCAEPAFYDKAVIHDYVKEHPGSIQVKIYPYPNLIPSVSPFGEKYVRSEANSYTHDNLLKLPRE